MSGDGDPPPSHEGGDEKPLLISLIQKGVFRFGFSPRYLEPRGFSYAEVWSPDRIDVEPGFSLNPYMASKDNIDSYRVNTPDKMVKLVSRLANKYVKVGGYDKFPFNRWIGWNIALKYWRRAIPWPGPSDYVREETRYKLVRLDTDVLVVGGGISGLHASLSSVELGHKTILIEMDYWVGGNYPLSNIDDIDGSGLNNLANRLITLGAKIFLNTVFQGFHSDYPYAIDWRRKILYIFNPKVFIFATGHYEIPPLIEGIHIPKSIPYTTYMKLIKRFRVKQFKNPVVYGFDDRLESLKKIFDEYGIDAIFIGSNVKGYTSYSNIENIKLGGKEKFEYADIEYDGGRERVYGDIFIYLGDRVSNSWVTLQTGILHLYIEGLGGYIPWHDIEGSTEKENIFIAGSLGGIYNFNYDVLTGLIAGLKAGEYLGFDVEERKNSYISQIRKSLDRDDKYDKLFGSLYRRENVYPQKGTISYRDKSKTILCRCHDVTLEDIDHSVRRLSTYDIEMLKRYSGVLTGVCQGKLCIHNLFRYLHINHGLIIKTIHHRIRPPYIPHPINSLEVDTNEI